MTRLLTVTDLHVYYGSVHALKGVSLEVAEGEVVALLGANGAGKTTLLRTISGLVRPRQGEIRLGDRVITHLPAHEIVALGVAHAPEGRRVFGTLTVEENLTLGAYVRGATPEVEETRAWVYDLFPRLRERRRQMAGTLSGGEQQMLAIGRALMARPRLLLLDEPSLGLAPLLVQSIFRTIAEIARQGVTILLVEQNARAALRLAQRGYVLTTGTILASGSAAELMAGDRVKAAYLSGRSALTS
ncbi:ABC transporter ATP-binding protein [Caldinitratiruptor microaerophilus]|uniref:ABC transporter ATP-binding protein n=1 Tax=Caldinitratiruptor microaerophilus TaxID=671077 RepID=A0AA35G8C7_9FIRM|nr:ABC transporter ATP-binding protein [Caldinitratiruptor microaerophilus]BDG60936.1 ABC transporter ATP-binding protein [Caldinitratiruptor microaerophilus]